jgi:hypothetical protein
MVAVTARARDGAPRWDTHIATVVPWASGPLCQGGGCAAAGDAGVALTLAARCTGTSSCPAATAALGGPAGPGRLSLRLTGDGDLVVAGVAAPGHAGNRTGSPVAVAVRACRSFGLAPRTAVPACTPVATGGPVAGGGGGVPSPGPVTVPGVLCSPTPPPFRAPPPTRRPAPRRHPRPRPEPGSGAGDVPRVVGVPIALQVPVELAFPAGHAPAANSQTNQVQQTEPGNASQVNPVTGVATGEEDRAQTVEEYAMARHDVEPPVVPWLAAVAVAAAAGAVRARQRAARPALRLAYQRRESR